MLNRVQKTSLVSVETLFSFKDDDERKQILSDLPFNYVDIVCLDANSDPVIPTEGEFLVYAKSSEDAGFESFNRPIPAVNCGGELLDDGDQVGAFFGSSALEIKIVPVGIVGAVSYKAYVRQNNQGNINPLPNDMVTRSRYGIRWRSVTNVNLEERFNLEGNLFGGSTERLNVPAISTYHTLLTTGDSYFAFEDSEVIIDSFSLTDGNLNIKLLAYFVDSDISSFTYTPSGIVVPAGRNLNSELINVSPLASLDRGGVVSGLTGSPDFVIYNANFYVNTQGNQNERSGVGFDFLEGSRKLIIPPNKQLLISTVSTGTAGGTYDIFTSFFSSEFEL